MTLSTAESELKATIEHLIHSGCHYVIEEFPKIYTPNLKIVMVDPSGDVIALDYEQNFQFFKSKKEAKAAPLDTTAHFNHIEVYGQSGYAVVTRHVALMDKPQKIVFSLSLDKSSGTWRVFRETAVIIGEA